MITLYYIYAEFSMFLSGISITTAIFMIHTPMPPKTILFFEIDEHTPQELIFMLAMARLARPITPSESRAGRGRRMNG
jgi:hypothetical protein